MVFFVREKTFDFFSSDVYFYSVSLRAYIQHAVKLNMLICYAYAKYMHVNLIQK